MSRDLSANFEAAIAAANLRPAIFVQMEFASGTVYAWSGTGQIDWDGKTWTGVGIYGGMSAVKETTDVQRESIRFTLSGIPGSMLAAALGDVTVSAPATAWLGLQSTTDWSIIDDPVLIFSGFMDVPVIDEGSDTATISITAESRLVILEQSAERRYTNDDQIAEYPGDKGFEYVAAIQDVEVIWS